MTQLFRRCPPSWPLSLVRPLLRTIAATVTLCWVGCDLPSRPTRNQETLAQTAAAVKPEYEPPAAAYQPGSDCHFVYFRDGEVVGYSTTQVSSAQTDNERINGLLPADALIELISQRSIAQSLWYEVEDVLEYRRGNATFLQILHEVGRESQLGELQGFWSRLQVGPAVTDALGIVDGAELEIRTDRGQSRVTRQLPWERNVRGLFAVAQSLRNLPLQPGQSRNLKQVISIKHDIAEVKLNAIGEVSVPWPSTPDGQSRPSQRLLEIAQETSVNQQVVGEMVLWVDSTGEIRRTYSPRLNLIAVRVDPDELQATIAAKPLLKSIGNPDDWSVDQVGGTTNAFVSVKGRVIENPGKASRVAFSLTPIRTDAANASGPVGIEPAPDQYIGSKDGQILLLVSRMSESDDGRLQAYQATTGQDDLKPTSLLDFNHGSVRDLLRIARNEPTMSQLDVIAELGRLTAANLEQRGAAGGFKPSSAIALSNQGGDAEHAILLASLLRAREIPSRIAMGLVYQNEPTPRLAFSVWTLAFADGRWIAVDAVTGKAAAANRIILATSDTVQPIDQSVFLQIFRQMEQIDATVVNYR